MSELDFSPIPRRSGPNDPATQHFVITPSNTEVHDFRALYAATGGLVLIEDHYGTVLPYPVSAGQSLPIQGVRVRATNTHGISGFATSTTEDIVLYGWK